MKILEKVNEKIKDISYRVEIKRILAKEKLNEVKADNRGIAVIEIILILVIVLGLIIIFRKNLKDMIDDIFKKIKGNQDTIVAPLN